MAQTFNVVRGRKIIDTVFYSNLPVQTAQEIEKALKENADCLDYFPVSGIAYDGTCDYLVTDETGIFLVAAADMEKFGDGTWNISSVPNAVRICDCWLSPKAAAPVVAATVVRFDIIDNQTGKVVDTAKTRDSANRKCDNRDNKYGAVRFIAKAVWSDQV